MVLLLGSQPVLLRSRRPWVSKLRLIPTCASSRFGFPRCQGTATLGTWRSPCSFLETKALGGVRGLAAGGPASPWMPVGTSAWLLASVVSLLALEAGAVSLSTGTAVCTFTLLLMELLLYPLVPVSGKGSREQLQLSLCSTEPI